MTTRTTMHFALALVAAACGGTARGTESYRADTQKLLDTRQATLKGCYDEALKTDAKLTGTVKVNFVVQKKTGVIVKPELDPTTAAPEPLGRCVFQALDGLKLDPPDRHEGRASFEYAFKPGA